MFGRPATVYRSVLGRFYSFYVRRYINGGNQTVKDILCLELKISDENVEQLLNNHKFLKKVEPSDLLKSINKLKSFKFTRYDITTYPKLLLHGSNKIENNYRRLAECGFLRVTANRLINHDQIMSKSVHFNISFNFLPADINVLHNIFDVSKVPVNVNRHIPYKMDSTLAALYTMALKIYLKERFKITPLRADETVKTYPSLKNRSIQQIEETVRLLEDAFNLPAHHLPKHMLKESPEQVHRTLLLKRVCGIDVRTIMTAACGLQLKNMPYIEAVLRKYGVPNYAVAFQKTIFCMSIHTLKVRLEQISKFKRANTFLKHPKILKLIMSMDRIKKQIALMNLDYDVFFDENFLDYFLNGPLLKWQKSSAGCMYLSDVLDKNEAEIKKALSCHPNSKKVSFETIRNSTEFLLNKNFTCEEIFENIYATLYSIKDLKHSLNRLDDAAEMAKLQIKRKELSNSQILRLSVYFIERDCSFTGEGVFTGSTSVISDNYGHMEAYVQMETIVQNVFKGKP